MITVCNMTSQHVAQVAALEKLCFADPWSENSVAAELEHDYSLWVVALEEDTVVGYVGAQISFEEADMMNVAVHPDHRRKGIAESVIDALIAQLKERGCAGLSLEVRASNIPAITLYEKMGFTQVGLRRNYYRNPKEDALILRKTL
jgi:ribosomal-protein-alanine N-acetyltransferase